MLKSSNFFSVAIFTTYKKANSGLITHDENSQLFHVFRKHRKKPDYYLLRF